MYVIAHGDEWVLEGWHGAGNSTADKKRDAGFRHAVNEALKIHPRPDLIIFGEHDEAPMRLAAQACYAAGFEVMRCAGRGADGIYSYCADLPDDMPVRVLGRGVLLGQLAILGCEVEGGQPLEVTALRTLKGVGPKTAWAILDQGDPRELLQRNGWLPPCRAAEKVRAGMSLEAYDAAVEELRLKRVDLTLVDGARGPAALRELGLGMLADRIEEGEYEPAS